MTDIQKKAVIEMLNKSWMEAVHAVNESLQHDKHNDPLGAESLRLHYAKEKALSVFAAQEAVLMLLGYIVRRDGNLGVTGLGEVDTRKFTVYFPWRGVENKTFAGERALREWIMDGIRGCEGAEQEHYTNLLLQLERGEKNLHY